MPMFPAFLHLRSRRVVVVGGGPVAASKLEALLAAGADVTVVAPEVRPEIEAAGVGIIRRAFEDADLDGAWWVVAAAPRAVNKQVLAAADARRVFVNAVDDPEHATAYLGGVVRRNGVTVAISTDGRAPALAGLLREAFDAFLPRDLEQWMTAADAARKAWKADAVPMEQRRPRLLEILNQLYETNQPGFAGTKVALVGAGPGDPRLWTIRAARLLKEADLVLYDALVDVDALRRLTRARCFSVGKRARRDSMPQETIHRLMIRAAKQGKRVVRLKGGDPFVFGRGGEEALALAAARIPFEVVPGVTTAIAAPELAGIPVTHRGIASGFLVLAGHTSEAVDHTLSAIRPNTISIVILMGVGARAELASRLTAHGWSGDTPAAIVCSASMPDAWTWTGPLAEMGGAMPPEGAAGVLVIGDVVNVRERLVALTPVAREWQGAGRAEAVTVGDRRRREVSYGRSR
jgi:uroporphyrin-III C-methyltransferase/precorrin-2 dehydrogenase/sirohydrochlorin ferrochelatase